LNLFISRVIFSVGQAKGKTSVLLYMPGMVAIRYNPLIKDMAQRLKAKGMAPKTIIAAAMHKLVHLIFGVLKTRQPFDANWAKKSTEVIEITLSVAMPAKINTSSLTFKTVSDPVFALNF
jgi:hypothetical protein